MNKSQPFVSVITCNDSVEAVALFAPDKVLREAKATHQNEYLRQYPSVTEEAYNHIFFWKHTSVPCYI